MAADEHVRRSFDALTARLREDIARQLDAASAELTVSVGDEQARVLAAAEEESARALARAAEAHEEAVERASQTAREQAERAANDRLALSVATAEANAREQGREEGRGEGRAEGRAEGREQGIAEGHHAGRLEGHEEGLREGREAGRTEALEDGRADRAGSDLAASERLVEAIRLMDHAKSLSEVLDTLVNCASREAARASVLLVRGSHLRAWRFIGFGAPLDERTDFEMPVADAGVINDAVRTGTAASGDSAVHASAPAFAPLPPGREALALPVAMSGQIVAVLYADQGDREPAGGTAWPAALEVMTRHAARSLEAITASRAAQVLTERPDVPAAPAAAESATPAARVVPGAGRAEEEQAARRYARLLISEIKLYHEPEVIAGRRERNLAERLAGEIGRARVLYEQRIPPAVRQSGDYFQEELVRTLADGDGTLVAQQS